MSTETTKNKLDYDKFKEFKDSLKTKDEVQKEIIDYFSNKDYCTIHDCSSETMMFSRGGIELKIKIRNYPIFLNLSVNPGPYSHFSKEEINIKTILGGSDTALSYSTYYINGDNYLERLDNYIKNVIEAYDKYKVFIQNIINEFDIRENDIKTLVDLNQYILYIHIKFNNRTVVVTPSFEVDNGKIIPIAYIGNDNSRYPTKTYVNSANMSDTYDLIEFFL